MAPETPERGSGFTAGGEATTLGRTLRPMRPRRFAVDHFAVQSVPLNQSRRTNALSVTDSTQSLQVISPISSTTVAIAENPGLESTAARVTDTQDRFGLDRSHSIRLSRKPVNPYLIPQPLALRQTDSCSVNELPGDTHFRGSR